MNTSYMNIDNIITIILIIIVLLMLIFTIIILKTQNTNKTSSVDNNNEKNIVTTNEDKLSQYRNIYRDTVGYYSGQMDMPSLINDNIRDYDYRKIYDPLENPGRRVERHQLLTPEFQRITDIPTRGYPDNYRQIGILKVTIKDNKDEKRKIRSNDILKLYGRQEYPGSPKYEYYTIIESGNNDIKIDLDIRKNEVYNGDNVYVDIMNTHYEVELYKYDQPRYQPFIHPSPFY